MASTCRVLIVEGSGRASQLILPVFGDRLVQVGEPVGYGAVVDAIAQHRPQLVILELDGAPLEAVAAVEVLMAHCPTPVLLLTGSSSKQIAIRALGAGALDVVEKPTRATPEFFKTLSAQMLLLSQVSVMRHLKGRRLAPKKAPFKLIAIAASLGGPKALARVLRDLPRPLDAAVMICQHITPGFSDDLARWLTSETGREVTEVNERAVLAPNHVIVAGSHAHLIAQADFSLKVDPSAPVGGFRPSCDVLLRSAAASFKDRAIGVVLTGMGRDGARGLKEIRARGGHTIAQDAATSVVFGMPGEAIALGAAELVLPLEKIGAQLGRWVSG